MAILPGMHGSQEDEKAKSQCCQSCCWCARCPTSTRGRTLCGVGVCCALFAVFMLLLAVGLGTIGGGAITTLAAGVREDAGPGRTPVNGIRKTWLPGEEGCNYLGNKTDQEIDACGNGCYDATFISQVDAFYASSGFKSVNMSSRAGPAGQAVVELQAWYIPPAAGTASGDGPAPRVVVCHGTNQNNQKFEALIAGVLLSSAGFGVLMPSLRDHGASGSSDHGLFSWGWDYPYDVLGAWDYAKDDPEGVMGGTVQPDKVGLMGFSMGGFTVVNAFGMEKRVPAVWADAPVFSVKDIILLEMRKVIGPLALYGSQFAWAFANQKVELHYNHPAKVLPGDANGRKVYLVHNPSDKTVPTSQHDKMVEALSADTTPTLTGTWVKDSVCNNDTHRILHLQFPSEYRERLCLFWTEVFGQSQARCTNGSMIDLASR
uniref:Peptidase S9 prolyl oligopeptidase catalytic domain-containing protein n=1 Tax=Zooxanthella nutricula TaxID=1333877 RepID=A0A6U9HVE3_9DINO